VEQAAGDGVFDGGHTDAGGVALDILEHLFKSGTADELNLFTLEVLVCGDVVERPELSLYGYSLHILFLILKSYIRKSPTSLL
jgi:hypothetical protein